LVLAFWISVGVAVAWLVFGGPDPASVESAPPRRTIGGLVAVAAALLVVSAFVSGSETAIFSLGKLDILKARKSGARSPRALLYLLDRPNDTLTTILTLNNLSNVALSLTVGALMQTLLTGHAWGAFAAAGLTATALILVFGEVVPKCVAHVKAPVWAPVAAWPIAAFAQALKPLRRAANVMIGVIFRKLRIPDPDPTGFVSEEELKAVISAGEVSAVLEEDEREMIHGVFELDETFAEEIMVPRTEVTALPDSLDQVEMLDRLRRARHSRVVIHHENLDHLVGFVLIKEVLLNPDRPWQESLREMLCVPSRVDLLELLTLFRRGMTKIAAVVDEFGGVTGIVTLHDLLEEIVGDMAERHEPAEQEFRPLGPDRWIVRGRMNLYELGRKLGVEFPDNLGHTLGGFVMNSLGRIPAAGEELRFNGLLMRVTRVIGRRVAQVEIVQGENGRSDAARAAEGAAR
jgi:CBS domain containing-hemolysin-like protein